MRRRYAGLVVAALAVGTTSGNLLGGQTTTTNDTRVAERIAVLQREAADLAGQSRTLVGEVRKLEVQRDLQTTQAQQADRAAGAVRRDLAEVGRRLAALETQRVETLPALQAQLVDLYKRGRRGEWGLLLAANGLREFARASRAVTSMAYRRRRVVDDYQRTLATLRQEQETLVAKSQELRTQEARARLARDTADRAVAARTALLDDIDSRRDLAAQYLSELQEARERAGNGLTARATDRVVETVSVPIGPFRGALRWPAAGRVAQRFGQPGPTPGSVRNGIEIQALAGAAVQAVHDGVVEYAEGYTGLGTLVILDHGGNNYSLYGYLSEALVKRGETVRTGADIGHVGPPPVAGPPALYFELRIDGRLVDPVQWLEPR